MKSNEFARTFFYAEKRVKKMVFSIIIKYNAFGYENDELLKLGFASIVVDVVPHILKTTKDEQTIFDMNLILKLSAELDNFWFEHSP